MPGPQVWRCSCINPGAGFADLAVALVLGLKVDEVDHELGMIVCGFLRWVDLGSAVCTLLVLVVDEWESYDGWS